MYERADAPAYTFQGRKEVRKYQCAFPLLSKLPFFPYIFEKRHTLNTLLTDTSIGWTLGVGFRRFFFVIFLHLYSLKTHTPLKRTTDSFQTVNGHF